LAHERIDITDLEHYLLMSKYQLHFFSFALSVLSLLCFTTLSASADDGQNPLPPPATSAIHLNQEATTEPLIDAAGVGCGGPLLGAYDAGFEQAVVEMVNQERANEGLPPLKLMDDLVSAARYHAQDMAEDRYFDHHTHDRIDEELVLACNWSDRVRAYYTGWAGLGENIACGYTSPENAMNAWMRSEGHHDNLLGNYREIGIGYYDLYWVQNFGLRDNVYPIIINDEAAITASVDVTIYAYGDWEQVRFRNDNSAWSAWQSFANRSTWTLPNTQGIHRVHAELKRGSEVVSSSDTIEYVNAQAAAEEAPGTSNVVPAVFLPLVNRS
jgi:uncharacterized protein YkwD